MARRGKIAAVAWGATLAASCALLPLVERSDWIVQAAVLLSMVTGVGVLARWRGLSPLLTGVLQTATGVFLITLTTVPQHAVAGFVPGPAALEELSLLFTAGGEDVSSYSSPAPLTDGIRLLLVSGVLLVGLVVDLLATTLRSAAAAGLPLLAMYSAAAGIADEGARWPYFLIAAAGFLALLLTESRYEIADWGRFFPGPRNTRPGAPEARTAGPRLRTGRRVGAVALGVALITPLGMPAMGDGLLDPSGSGRGSGSGDGVGSIAVNPAVALQNHLTQPVDRTVLTYETDAEQPRELYLRMISLDRFDGEEWYSSQTMAEEIPEAPWPVAGLSQDVPTTVVTTRITAEPGYSQHSLPVPAPAVDIAVDGSWEYDVFSRTLHSRRSEQTTAGRTWEVRHLLLEPTPEQLAQAPAPTSSVIRDELTEVPASLPDTVREKALEVTAGARNDHERAVALQNWFTRDGGFRYNTDVASGTGPDAVANFLVDREGFCIHFAFSMAAMARTLDIPAQVSVGFTPGRRLTGNTYEVGLHNAHAWPELYFEGVGWIRFEPTPGQGSTPAHTRPVPQQPEPGQPEPEPTEETERPDPSPSASSPADPRRCDPMLEPEACLARQEDATAEEDDAMMAWPVVWGAGGGVLLAAALTAPMLWRNRLRRRRLAPGAGALAAWEELVDTAWDLGIPPEPSETPRQAARRIVRIGELSGEAEAAVHRVADAVELHLYAPAPAGAGHGTRGGARGTATAGGAEPDAVAGQVRTAAQGLRATAASPEIRFRARMLPASASRMTQRLTERYLAAAGTLSARMHPRRLLRRAG